MLRLVLGLLALAAVSISLPTPDGHTAVLLQPVDVRLGDPPAPASPTEAPVDAAAAPKTPEVDAAATPAPNADEAAKPAPEADAATTPAPEADAATTPAPEAASQDDELNMAEVEWKDAFDSTLAPGQLEAEIKKPENATGSGGDEWIRRMVEEQKKGGQAESMITAKKALASATLLMKDGPVDEIKTSDMKMSDHPKSHLAATIQQQEKSTEDLKRVVAKYTSHDEVVKAAEATIAGSKAAYDAANAAAATAEAALKQEAEAHQAQLEQEHMEAKGALVQQTKARQEAMNSAAQMLAEGPMELSA